MKRVTLDCRGVTDARHLHEALKEALGLPDWYGHNLDALFDCLTELDEETLLVLLGWKESAYSGGFELVFADAAMENPVFTYTIV